MAPLKLRIEGGSNAGKIPQRFGVAAAFVVVDVAGAVDKPDVVPLVAVDVPSSARRAVSIRSMSSPSVSGCAEIAGATS